MNIELVLNNQTLNITDCNEKQVELTIKKFFNILNNFSKAESKLVTQPKKEEIPRSTKTPVATIKPIINITKSDEKSISRSHQLPLVGSNKSATFKPFADLAEKLSIEQVSNSGIRELEDGKKLYKSHYWCSECGHEGTRYVDPNNRYMKCHECNEKLTQEPATFEDDENGIPLPDSNGNYFLARDLYGE